MATSESQITSLMAVCDLASGSCFVVVMVHRDGTREQCHQICPWFSYTSVTHYRVDELTTSHCHTYVHACTWIGGEGGREGVRLALE